MPFGLLLPLFTGYHLEQILRQLSKAITLAIDPSHNRHDLIPLVLRDLVGFKDRPHYLRNMAYEWCSLICKNQQHFEDRESLYKNQHFEDWKNAFLSLEIGFRHLDLQDPWDNYLNLTHTEHHQRLADVVFESGDGEAIADLLHAWTVGDWYREPARALLGTCTGRLIDLHNLVPFSSRLRRLVIHSVKGIGYGGFEGVGVERFLKLLDYLHVTVDDMDSRFTWVNLLLDIVQSPEGIRHLSHWYWELLMEISKSLGCRAYNPQIAISLTEAQEWDKLECWVRTVWIMWPPGPGRTTEEYLQRLMLPLFRQRPDFVQKLGQWMEQWSKKWDREVPECFRRTCQRAWEAAQWDLRQV